MRRAIGKAEAELPDLVEQARGALFAFEMDAGRRLDVRYRKAAQGLLALLAEDHALTSARADMHHMYAVMQARIPTSLHDIADRGTWRSASNTGLGDVPSATTDAAAQVAEARRMLAEAERAAAPVQTSAA